VDVAIARGEVGCRAAVMGGQAVGVVERIEAPAGGAGRVPAGVVPGARVVVADSIPCAVCESCRRGLAAHCPQRGVLGVTRDGALAQQLAVPVGARAPRPASVVVDFSVVAGAGWGGLHVAGKV
jgi:D-arabinose 1-dehydrogenase-like Zn-dependent alcohol dehydrogenase